MIFNQFKRFISDKFTDQKKIVQKQIFQKIQQGKLDDILQIWKSNQIDANYSDERGLTFLMAAVCYSIDHLEEGKMIIKFLLEQGADVNKTDHGGRSSFLMACHWDLQEIVEIFLNYKPNLDSDTQNRFLILNPTYTVLLKGNYKMAKFLLDHGADYNKIFELHNFNDQIRLNGEMLSFLYQYKIEKQKLIEKQNLLFVRQSLIQKAIEKNEENITSVQSPTGQSTQDNNIFLVQKLNKNELKEVLKYF
ncbi:hypothetical protein ABPG72_005436 [Tetrahymena utriculariae]